MGGLGEGMGVVVVALRGKRFFQVWGVLKGFNMSGSSE